MGSFKATIDFFLPPTACMALVTKIMVLIPSSMPVDQDQAAQFRAVPVNMSCWFLGVDLEQVKGEVSHLVDSDSELNEEEIHFREYQQAE